MSGTRGRGAPVSNNKSNAPTKKGQDTKQANRPWAAEDYATESVSVE
jgi:hypothetical protein